MPANRSTAWRQPALHSATGGLQPVLAERGRLQERPGGGSTATAPKRTTG